MSYLRSLKPEAGLLQIFEVFPRAARPLLEYHEVLLRRDSPFTAAERGLIAAYLSSLNKCNYCCAVHPQTTVVPRLDAKTAANLLANLPPAETTRSNMFPTTGG